MTNLELLRRKRGWTQAELGRRLGLPRAEISKLENRWTARVWPRVEAQMRELFGPSWDFAALMREPTPSGPDTQDDLA